MGEKFSNQQKKRVNKYMAEINRTEKVWKRKPTISEA